MGCIIVLIGLFFLLYTVFFVLQTMNRLKLAERKREERGWASVVESAFFVPMLCVLFLAVRLQALQLTDNQPEKYGLPQWWVRLAMIICTVSVVWAVSAQICLVFASKTQEEAEAGMEGTCPMLAKVARMNRKCAMALLYVCFTIVCVGACVMQAHPGLVASGAASRLSPAVLCTVFLSVMYFAVYLGLACTSKANDLGLFGQRLRFCQALEYVKSATTAIVFSPMLCAVFLACQAHAMQLDPVHGRPQGWAQTAFYICCGCVVTHTLVAVAGTFADMRELQGDGAPSLKTRTRAIDVINFVLMAGLYGGVIAIIVSIYRFGNAPSSLSLHCITALTVIYFAVSLAHLSIPLLQRTVLASPASRMGEPSGFEVYVGVLAKEAVAFCPKFCILFLGTVLRAQQLTNGLGAPQGWCQVAQCVAAVCIVLLTGVRMDVLMPEPGRLSAVCMAIQYFCLSLLYISAIAIVVALFLLTPENATGWGTISAAAM
uniref:Uncharacterized protein n=1 Tax=Alexandrium catenella TaxID=2925 RepID=A0A7S1S5T0_ALECA